MFDTGDIESVVSREHVQQQRGVIHRPCHGSAVVPRQYEGHDAPRGHKPVGGFEAYDAAICSRRPDRSAGVRAKGTKRQSGCNGGSGSAGRSAWVTIELPRVTHGSKVALPIRKLVKV